MKFAPDPKNDLTFYLKIFALLGLLMVTITAGNLYVRGQINSGSDAIKLQNMSLRSLHNVHAASNAFGDFKYWYADLANSASPDSEREADAALVRLNTALMKILEINPASVQKIQTHLATIREKCVLAKDAIAVGDRKGGLEHLVAAHAHIASVDVLIETIIKDLREEAELRGESVLQSSQLASRMAIYDLAIPLVVSLMIALMIYRIVDRFRQDIAARSILESELRRHQERLQDEVEESRDTLLTAFDTIDAGVGLVDAKGRTTFANNKLCQFYPRIHEFVKRRAHISEVLKSQGFVTRNIPTIGHDISEYSVSEQQIPDGRWMRIQRSPTPDGGYIALYSDVTNYKNQSAELAEKAQLLEESLETQKELNERQRQFVAIASHEFRTPLSIIDSSVRRIVKNASRMNEREVERRAAKINSAVDRMVSLIDSTLAVARMDSGELSLSCMPVDVASLVEEIVVRQQDVAAMFVFERDIERLPTSIDADASALDQILTNLLSNAVKYSGESKQINIKGWTEGSYAVLSVSDQGIGISREDLGNMFQRFFRAQNTSGIEGTGIGLNLVKRLVEEHGGDISVTSTLGEGSTFTVRLPISQSDIEDLSEKIPA